MNLRTLPLIDKLGLMLGSEVPVSKLKYFLQVEKTSNDGAHYTRSWSPIDEIRQTELHDLEQTDYDMGFRKTIHKTGNTKILKLIQDRTVFFVEIEDNSIKEYD